MKKLLIVFLFFNQFVFSQDFKVLKTEKIQIKRNEQFFFPKLSPDGSKILYTKQNYKGLYLYDLKKKTVFQISGKQGSGYKPVFSKNGTDVFYRENDYEGMRKTSAIYSFNLKNKEKKIIEPKKRKVTVPQISGNKLFYTVDGKVKNKTLNSSDIGEDIWTLIDKQKIVLCNKGVKKVMTPNGEGNYIWVSLSPDKKKILYTFSGHGTYISDLNGKLISDLGYLNAPVWYNDNWIVGMKDYDDGNKYTSSDIYAVSVDGKISRQLTVSENLTELYPQCSADNSKIVYHTYKGDIYLLTINK